MSHTIGCYVDDGLAAVVTDWDGGGGAALPIAPWSWGNQDSLYAAVSVPGGPSPMSGADAATPPSVAPDSKAMLTRLAIGGGAVLVGGFLLKFAYDAAKAHKGLEREPLAARVGSGRIARPMPEPWHIPDESLTALYGPAVARAKAKTRIGTSFPPERR